MAADKAATLYRMVLPDHICPFGIRAKQMLEDAGFAIDEHILRTREEVDAFEEEHGVDTTPQVFIDGERIGGSDELERHLERAWTQLFFGEKKLGASAIASGAMLATGAAYVAAADRVDRPAAAAAVPFVAWLGFATLLAERVWQRNPPGGAGSTIAD